MVPADSRRIPRDPRYSGSRWGSRSGVYRTFTVYGGTFQTLPLGTLLPDRGPTTPTGPEPCRFGLIPVRSPLLGESLTCFLFLRVLRCFSSPGWPPPCGCRAVSPAGCPIRRSAGQGSFAPHRGFSQLITSFIACKSQGIRHTPFPTFFRS